MENSTFLSQHLGTPSLMVLASTAEAARDSGHPPFPGHLQGLDKDHFPGIHALFQRQNNPDLFSHRDFPHHLLPMHPQFRHTLEAARFFSTTGSGAFRRFNSEDRENSYHSAFVPTKRLKPSSTEHELTSHSTGKDFPFSSSFDKDHDSHRHSPSEVKKSEGQISVSTYEGDSTDQSSPDDCQSATGISKSSKADGSGRLISCPICSVSLQLSEITHHYAAELEKVARAGIRSNRKSLQEKQVSSLPASQTESPAEKNTDGGSDLPSLARYENFKRVRSNRQQRLHAARSRKKKRVSEEFALGGLVAEGTVGEASTSGIGISNSTCPICSQKVSGSIEEINSHAEACIPARSRKKKRVSEEFALGGLVAEGTVGEASTSGIGISNSTCPICSQKVSGSIEEINSHAEACIRKQRHSPFHDDDSYALDTYEEYEWAGQKRIRVTTMLEGGFAASGFHVNRRKEDGDSDADLNVDGDDNEAYGTVQYTERDVIPCTSDEPSEEKARQALRGAILKASAPSDGSPASSCDRSRWENFDLSKDKKRSNEQSGEKENSEELGHDMSPDDMIAVLKGRIKELEKQSTKSSDKHKCLICMESYHTPVVSVQCWHVHCEECWLRTLGAKKLCPQCNMITSPSDLRKIYL
ncbi:E3 ubiquitin-protein ligase RNF220-like [Saccoglossus kowalevskii]